MRILLADDHTLVREALAAYVQHAAPQTQVTTADTLDAALALVPTASWDIVILDLRMPGMNGLEGLDRMIAAVGAVPVALMSGSASPELVREAVTHGARGFFPKTLSAPGILPAIQLVVAGERYIPASGMDGSEEAPADGDPRLGSLSNRERSVLDFLTRGCSNKEIARTLNLHEATIKLHVRGICRKLGAKNRTQAAMIAQGSHAA